MSKAITRFLRHDQPAPRGSDEEIHYSDIVEECRKKKKFEKRFQYCLNPNTSNQFLYFRAIQRHSGDNAIDPVLQDNVLLPKGFTEYIYHVGNASELISIVRNGLIPGGKSLKRGRQAVFFTTETPTEDVYGMEKVRAILRNQGSRHTRILGNAFKIQYVGAI